VVCARCGEASPGVESAPFPGALGEELKTRICHNCWSEWQRLEVMVINELHLNFMEPRSMDILVQHMREFLCLDRAADPQE
jgi:Fe-S cluster biosynthesis and repair protein YggX